LVILHYILTDHFLCEWFIRHWTYHWSCCTICWTVTVIFINEISFYVYTYEQSFIKLGNTQPVGTSMPLCFTDSMTIIPDVTWFSISSSFFAGDKILSYRSVWTWTGLILLWLSIRSWSFILCLIERRKKKTLSKRREKKKVISLF
jgi:hypothetical protein